MFACILASIDSQQAGQDLQIYGKFNSYLNPIDTKELSFITTKCFQGLMFSTCRPTNVPDDYFGQSVLLPYYVKFASLYGTMYCVQCCGTEPDHIDHWNLECQMDIQTVSASNAYGNELRLAARQQPTGDKNIITCPLKRSACAYDGKKTLNCDGQATDTTYLVGYTLTITVQQLDVDFGYWRGVTDCDIVTEESNTMLQPGDNFRETIIMVHIPNITNSRADFGKTVVTIIAFFFFIYVTLYYFRRNKCVYCQGKLVFSKELCVRCTFVGAKPPDPFLLQALEEKGEHIQGEHPERFPGSRVFVQKLLKLRKQVEDCLGVNASRVGPETPEMENGDEENAASGSSARKFKYPKWLKWFKKWRTKRLKRLQEEQINPNILTFPKHIIFGAIGHHDPPAPSDECIEARKRIIAESLGYNPEDYADGEEGAVPGEGNDSGVDGESKSQGAAGGETKDKVKVLPSWQQAFTKQSPASGTPVVVSWRLKYQLRRGFTKARNRGPPIHWRFVLPFCAALTCLTVIFGVVIASVLNLVDFSTLAFR